ncbi:MAG: YcjX family protein, partial [Pseudomonadota bacterium]
DRQIVLVDVLRALSDGPAALSDLEQAMGDILQSFRPGRNGLLQEIFLGKRVERILFAATKADHLHHSQHPHLTGIVQAMVAQARNRADFHGALTTAMSIAALRSTTETQVGQGLPAVQGIVAGTGTPTAYFPGSLPTAPDPLLAEARAGADHWGGPGFAHMRFSPPRLNMGAGDGPPHIRLDKALQFLIGDKIS